MTTRRTVLVATATQQAPCPQCGEPVALSLATSETSDQIAAERTACPNCGVPLARAIDGHADGGWRVDERPGGDEQQPDAMTEQHRIVGPASGEPLSDDRVGVRVRIPLSGCPSRRWSRDLSARLANELVRHPAVGHLRLNDIVQGDQLVLEGVEEREAPLLSHALARAVTATNAECTTDPGSEANVPQPRADAIAGEIAVA
jgi:ribosomal protein S27AE